MSEGSGRSNRLSQKLGLPDHKFNASQHFGREVHNVDDDETPSEYDLATPAVGRLHAPQIRTPTTEQLHQHEPNRPSHRLVPKKQQQNVNRSSHEPSSSRVSIPIGSGQNRSNKKPLPGHRSNKVPLEIEEEDSLQTQEDSSSRACTIPPEIQRDMDHSTELFEQNLSSTRASRKSLNRSKTDEELPRASRASVQPTAASSSAKNTHYSGLLNQQHLFPHSNANKAEATISRPPPISPSTNLHRHPSASSPSQPSFPKQYRVVPSSTAIATSANAQRHFQATQHSSSHLSSPQRHTLGATLPIVRSSRELRGANNLQQISSTPPHSPASSALVPSKTHTSDMSQDLGTKRPGGAAARGKMELEASTNLFDFGAYQGEELVEQHRPLSERAGKHQPRSKQQQERKHDASTTSSPLDQSMELDESPPPRNHSKSSGKRGTDTAVMIDDDDDDDRVLAGLRDPTPLKPHSLRTSNASISKDSNSLDFDGEPKPTKRRHLFSGSTFAAPSPSTSTLEKDMALSPSEEESGRKPSTRGAPRPLGSLDAFISSSRATSNRTTGNGKRTGTSSNNVGEKYFSARIPGGSAKKLGLSLLASSTPSTAEEPPTLSTSLQQSIPVRKRQRVAVSNVIDDTLAKMGTSPPSSPPTAVTSSTQANKRRRPVTARDTTDSEFQPSTIASSRPRRSPRTKRGPATIELIELSDGEGSNADMEAESKFGPEANSQDSTSALHPDEAILPPKRSKTPGLFDFPGGDLLSGSKADESKPQPALRLPRSSRLDDQLHFNLSYFQDDIGRGHVSLEAPKSMDDFNTPSQVSVTLNSAQTASEQHHIPTTPKKASRELDKTASTTVHESQDLCYDSRLSFSLNHEGIFIWKVLPPPKKRKAASQASTKKQTAEPAPTTETELLPPVDDLVPDAPQSDSLTILPEAPSNDTNDMDIDAKEDPKTDSDMEIGTVARRRSRRHVAHATISTDDDATVNLNETIGKDASESEKGEPKSKAATLPSSAQKPKRTAAKPKSNTLSPTHELLAHIPTARIASVDVFAQPGLFFIYTSSGPSMTTESSSLLYSQTQNPTSLEKSGEEPSAARNPDNTLSSSSDPIDLTSPPSNRKKRGRLDNTASNGEGEVQQDVELAPRSSKRSKPLHPTQSPTFFDTRSHPIRKAHFASKMDFDGSSSPTLDLSYEVDPSDDSAMVPPLSKHSQQSVTSNDESESKPKPRTMQADSSRLFVVVCDRDDLHNILSQLMELSTRQVTLSQNGMKDLDQSDELAADDHEPSVKPRNFEIFGRGSSLKPIPSELLKLWWKPNLVAEEDKGSSTALKSPASKLKSPPSTPYPRDSSQSLPIVYSKSALNDGKAADGSKLTPEEIAFRKQSQHRYCAPFSLGNTLDTMQLAQSRYEDVRQKLFGDVWPVSLISPPLRGLFASSIENAPRLYISPPSTLFHQSTLPTPLADKIQTRSKKGLPSSASAALKSPSDTAIITFPPEPKRSLTSDPNYDASIANAAFKSGSVPVRQMDVDRLQPGVYLNDNLVDFYLKYIQLRLMSEENRKRVRIFSSHFFTLLADQGYSRVSNWTQKQNMFEYDFIIVPVNMHWHWKVAVICNPGNAGYTYRERIGASEKKNVAKKTATKSGDDEDYDESVPKAEKPNRKKKTSSKLAEKVESSSQASVTDPDEKKPDDGQAQAATDILDRKSSTDDPRQCCILVLDSLGSRRDTKVANELRGFMEEEARKWNRPVQRFDTTNMTAYQPRAPQQTNFTDCGLFLLHYMEKFCLQLPDDVSKTAINELINEDWFPVEEVDGKRRKIAECIDSLVKEQMEDEDM